MTEAERTALYSELGQAWRQFVGWRDKIFAGYLTALAALAVGYNLSGTTDHVVILVAVILVSLVFWAIDVRTHVLVLACQRAGASIEELMRPLSEDSTLARTAWKRGYCSTLNYHSRIGTQRVPNGITHRITYGLAVDGLVGATSIGATVRMCFEPPTPTLALIVATGIAFVLVIGLHSMRAHAASHLKDDS
jgi:hypothetical protein